MGADRCHHFLAVLLAALGCSPQATVQLVGFVGQARALFESHAEHVSLLVFLTGSDTVDTGTSAHYASSCAQVTNYASGCWTVVTAE
jgi:hypothetical protein